MTETKFITVTLGSGETPSVLLLDINKLCFLTFKPETREQTAKLVLDFGSSQKIFEKTEAGQVYQELVKHTEQHNPVRSSEH
ncbi:hypothetical protein [Pontibacter sp. HJ8]